MTEKRILCFGDSLTWGWVPKSPPFPSERYPRDVRWTGVLADRLGGDYAIVEEGLSARTTTADDPTDPRLNGSAYLPAALATHLPLDIAIVMLGTNDTKSYLHRSASDIGLGMSVLAGQVLTSGGGVGTLYPAPKLLIVSPPPLADIEDPWFATIFADGKAKSEELADVYRSLAAFLGVDFFDAGSVIQTGGVDGVHLTEQNNVDLGEAIAEKVRSIVQRTTEETMH